MRELFFISHPWGPSAPAYANGERITLNHRTCIDHGDSSNSLEFTANNHIGTHFDFPRHFSNKGKTLDNYPPEFFIFKNPAVIWLECEPGILVSIADLEKHVFPNNLTIDMILIRTGIGRFRQDRDFWERGVGIGLGVAEWLREKFPSLRVLGVDAISITSLVHRETGRIVHREFLGHKNPIVLIEDVNLEVLSDKELLEVIALPLRIEGADGAPCTMVAKCRSV